MDNKENASQICSRAGFDPQAERKKLKEMIFRLSKEVDYKNYKYLELECKHDETAILFRKVATRLTEIIESRDRSLSELEHKLRESSKAIQRLASENDRLVKQCSREMSARQSMTINLESDLERHKIQYEKLDKELKDSIAQRDSMQRDLEGEIIKLKNELKDQKGIESNINSKAEIDALKKEINEKEDTIWDLQALNTTLAARDFESNKEVNDCRKELLDGLQDILTRRTKLVIKRMGELDEIPFQKLCYERFPGQDWEGMAAKICSFWQDKVIDPHWHPFKIIHSSGVTKEIVNEEDEKLRLAREELGELGYKAVKEALVEMNEYNPSGRYSVPEIWIEKEARKASLSEAIRYVLQQLKAKKRKRL